MKNILVVDDDNMIRIMVKHALTDNYEVATVSSGPKAIKYLDTNEVDLILMDIEMPDMNGIETTKLIKSNDKWANIPIIFLTSDSDPITESECLKLGADDFIIKPVVPMVMNGRISRILELYELRNDLQNQLVTKTRQVEMVTINSIMSIANTIDAKDKYTSGHSIRVAQCAVEIARRLGWNETELQNMKYVALLHDIGKIGVPDSILNKPGRLTDAEFAVIKKHPVTGGEILKDIHTIDHLQDGALFHHERYDGKGYPFGLRGTDIPLCARIVGVADAYDAMTTNRVYRDKLSTERVISEFERGKGTQFDPNLADLFIEMIREGFSVVINEEESPETALYKGVIDEYTAEAKHSNSVIDSLTGLYNRNYAETMISERIACGHVGSLFAMDLDNFKEVNEKFGHIAGDKIIKIFADILKACSKENDIICRLSGDGFIAFFTDVNDRTAIQDKAQHIINTYHSSVNDLVKSDNFSVSIGISFIVDDEKDYSTIFNNADKALYYVKNSGKNKYHIYDDSYFDTDEMQDTSADLKNLKQILENGFVDSDSFMNVAYDEFQYIYDFISRYVKRSHQPVETILFTIVAKDQNHYPDIPSLENAMSSLKTAVIASLRASDVGTKFSSNQYIVLLMDADLDNGRMVAQRVINKFNDIYHGEEIIVKFDIEAIDAANDEEEEQAASDS